MRSVPDIELSNLVETMVKFLPKVIFVSFVLSFWWLWAPEYYGGPARVKSCFVSSNMDRRQTYVLQSNEESDKVSVLVVYVCCSKHVFFRRVPDVFNFFERQF
jgi:hypothetical protein